MPIDTPGSVARDERVQRSSSTAPALSALQRAIADRKGYSLQRSIDTVSDQMERDAHYIAPDGDRPRDVKEAGIGKPMAGLEVQRILKTLCPSILFEDSPVKGRICLNYVLRDEVLGQIKHNICSMERGLMPEFSILNVKEEQMMNKETGGVQTLRKIDELNPETRGWRTVLAKLIRAGIIGSGTIEKAFGTPTHTSKKWQDAICR